MLDELPLEELEPPDELLLDEDDPPLDELPPEELEPLDELLLDEDDPPLDELLLDDEDGAVMLAVVVALVLERE